jgi:hypothetical protein
MELGSTLEAIKKYGVNALMAVALIWMNSRVDKVESKLYECYDDQKDLYIRSNLVRNNNRHNNSFTKPILIAVLPSSNNSRTKSKKDEKDV